MPAPSCSWRLLVCCLPACRCVGVLCTRQANASAHLSGAVEGGKPHDGVIGRSSVLGSGATAPALTCSVSPHRKACLPPPPRPCAACLRLLATPAFCLPLASIPCGSTAHLLVQPLTPVPCLPCASPPYPTWYRSYKLVNLLYQVVPDILTQTGKVGGTTRGGGRGGQRSGWGQPWARRPRPRAHRMPRLAGPPPSVLSLHFRPC